MPLLLLGHARQNAHGDLERTEIVELHRPLEIVEAVERILDGPADRTAGIVDQDIDAPVLGEQALHDRFGGRHVGQVGDVGVQPVAGGLELAHGFRQLLAVVGDGHHLRPRLGELERRRLADARRGAGDQDDLAGDLPAQRAVYEKIGVEMALPVIPQAPGITVERRHRDTRPFEGARRFAAIEAGRVVEKAQDVFRQPEVVHQGGPDAAHRLQRQHTLAQIAGDEAEQRGIDAQ